MNNKSIEISDVIRRFIDPYKKQFGDLMLPSHHRAIRDILACMTEEMGGGRYQCQDCNDTFWSYHGCRNRACPKCHGRQIAIWIKKRTAELLPCGYFHAVATIPAELRPFFLRHQKLLYGMLVKIASSVLGELAKEERFVGASPGIMAVLHTWTRQIDFHPHVHLLVTGGGVSKDGATWHPASNGFLVPVKLLSSKIRTRFKEILKKEHPELFEQIPPGVWQKEWCSFCKHFGSGPEAIIRYLARYVFRQAITSNRILDMDETHVTFKYQDNKTQLWKTMRISGIDFIRRFLFHVLPRGFHKVRYYGLWSAANQAKQRTARILLEVAALQAPAKKVTSMADLAEEALKQSDIESHAFVIKCPKCKSENVVILERYRRGGVLMTV